MSTTLKSLQLDRGEDEPVDPLQAEPAPPDRVFYATGVLLDAADFNAEQIYHRSRLARALTYLHGSGTVAGLKVGYEPPEDVNSAQDLKEELRVDPGVAIDRFGRLIEVPRTACIRLNPWYAGQDPDDLQQSYYEKVLIPAHTEKNEKGEDVPVAKRTLSGVVADVFIRFVACGRGKTPAFASGPFDAIDAVQPSRLRDAYKLQLVLRKKSEAQDEKNPLPLPENIWPADRERYPAAVFDAWKRITSRDERNNLEPLREHLAGQDTSYVFLARVVLPTNSLTGLDADKPPVRRRTEPVGVINEIRPFVYSTAALCRLAGL